MLKNLIPMGVMFAVILLTLSLDVALAENENTTMQDSAIMPDNTSIPNKMSMPMSMPMNMPTNQYIMSEGSSNNIIMFQNVTLNIIMALNMTSPNDIQPTSIMGY